MIHSGLQSECDFMKHSESGLRGPTLRDTGHHEVTGLLGKKIVGLSILESFVEIYLMLLEVYGYLFISQKALRQIKMYFIIMEIPKVILFSIFNKTIF